MSDDRKTTDMPTAFVITSPEQKPSDVEKFRFIRKKTIIFAVSGVAIVAIILTAILVGMYFFTEAEKEIIKFSLNTEKDTKQEVTGDPNTNVVQYHVINKVDGDFWVVNDFNRDIQVVKMQSPAGTNCYVSPLNRTLAVDPSNLKVPSNSDSDPDSANTTYTVYYRASNNPIADINFLSNAARDTCKGISTYWLYPSCSPTKDSDVTGRQKRSISCSWCGCKKCWRVLFARICVAVTWCD